MDKVFGRRLKELREEKDMKQKEVIETHSQNGNMVKTQTSLIPE